MQLAQPVYQPAAPLAGGQGWVVYPAVKRLIDLGAALLLLTCLLPVMALCALAVLLETGFPIFFRQVRVGEGGRHFTMLKFRSMVADADPRLHQQYVTAFIEGTAAKAGGEVYKLVGDPRVTRVGRFLRRTSLDELPQLWNVVKGEMSLVGPRPPIPYEVEQYRPADLGRLRAKPGITGLWQVSGRSRTTFAEMVEMDLRYIRTRSLALDLSILLMTVPVVFARAGAH